MAFKRTRRSGLAGALCRDAAHEGSVEGATSRLVLGQKAVDEKSNEITAILALGPN
jgi:hypothetical protein